MRNMIWVDAASHLAPGLALRVPRLKGNPSRENQRVLKASPVQHLQNRSAIYLIWYGFR